MPLKRHQTAEKVHEPLAKLLRIFTAARTSAFVMATTFPLFGPFLSYRTMLTNTLMFYPLTGMGCIRRASADFARRGVKPRQHSDD